MDCPEALASLEEANLASLKEYADDYWRQAANKWHAEAKCCLAHCYWHGSGVEENQEAACNLLLEAAKLGNTKARDELLALAESGNGVAKSTVVFRLTTRVEQTMEQQLSAAGKEQRIEENLKRENLKREAKNIEKAAKKGSPGAQYRLGQCYEQGKGVAQDPTRALLWYQKAADQGHEEAKREASKLRLSAK